MGVAVGVGLNGGVGRGCGVGRGLGVGPHLPVHGVGVGVCPRVYSSALAEASKVLFSPAATRTMPLGSKVAVCSKRAVFRLPVKVQVPFGGSYSSALAKTLTPVIPPATRTMPL